MSKGAPFFSTTPLDILASLMMLICLLSVGVILLTTYSVFASIYEIHIDFNVSGYDILITRGAISKTGYGIMFQKGIKLWQYKESSTGAKKELQIFPS
jgi:hypothetical protein